MSNDDDINISTNILRKEDYDFVAWNTSKDGRGEWYKSGSVYHIKYDFCDELNAAGGISDTEKSITPTGALGSGADLLYITIPKFNKKDIDFSQFRNKIRIRYQGGMYK